MAIGALIAKMLLWYVEDTAKGLVSYSSSLLQI
jgi:hypothetical protein